MEKSIVGLMLVKERSKRLPGKNVMDFFGKPMFIWNLEKCLRVFDRVYVSSDSRYILGLAAQAGALTIERGDNLCGDVPDIPVYQHALSQMVDVAGIVAVHGNNPTIEQNLITITKKLLESGVPEVMTCYPMDHSMSYRNQYNAINGSIRGMSVERLENYPDPYKPDPEVLLVDNSVEIETPESLEEAKCQYNVSTNLSHNL